MEMIAKILMFVGYGGMIVAGIWMLVKIFQRSVGWGIASLLLGIPGIIYTFMNWSYMKKPFLIYLLFLVLGIVGVVLGGAGIFDALKGAAGAAGDLTPVVTP